MSTTIVQYIEEKKKPREKVNDKSVLTIKSCRHALILYSDIICMTWVCFAFRFSYIVISYGNNDALVALLCLL